MKDMTRMSKLRLAVIGCGAVAEIGHLPALAQSPAATATVLVDKNLDRAQKLAKRFDVPRVTDDYAAVVGQVDGAIVALPHSLHAPVTVALLSQGIHVLVEKPMALTTAECDQMIEAASSHGTTLAVGVIRRFIPSYPFGKEAIDSGLLGKVSSFDIRDGFVYNWPVASDFFFRKDLAGGGVLVDTGAYAMDLVSWWFGNCSSIRYADDSMGGVEANCTISLLMESGVQGFVDLSRTRNLRNTIVVRGEKATLEMGLNSGTVSLTLEGSTKSVNGIVTDDAVIADQRDPLVDRFRAELEDWVEAVSQKRKPRVSGEDGRRPVALIESCYSHRTPLKLPWESSDLLERPAI